MDIIIDHKIRDWVFLPIIFVMLMIGIFRHYLSEYQRNVKVRDKVKSDREYIEMCHKNFISKCQNFGKNCIFLTEGAYKTRKHFLIKHNATGHLVERGESIVVNDQPQMPMQANMADMLKNNITMGVSTMLQFGWISYFFSGFILAKIPFPLTQKFRVMLQKGVEIQNLNVGYVSSLSLYFLVLFGLSGFQKLILGSDDEDGNQISAVEDLNKMNPAMMMNPMMGGGMPGMPGAGGAGAGGGLPGMPGQGPDFKKLFDTEKENIELVRHKFALQNAEDILIEKLKSQLQKK